MAHACPAVRLAAADLVADARLRGVAARLADRLDRYAQGELDPTELRQLAVECAAFASWLEGR